MRKSVTFHTNIFVRGTTYWYRGTPIGSKRREEFSLGLKVGEVTQKEVLTALKERLESLEQRGSKKESKYETVLPKYLAERERENPSFKTMFEIKSVLALKYTARQRDAAGNLVVFSGKYLGPFLRGRKIHEMDQDLFDEYCKLNPEITLHNHVKVLNTFLSWCARRNYKKYHVEIKLPKWAKKEKRQRIPLKPEELLGLFKQLNGRALLYHVLYGTQGSRNLENLRLKWTDIFFETREYRIDRMSNKNRRERRLPLNDLAIDILRALDRLGSPWVFPSRTDKSKPRHETSSYRGEFKAALKAMGVERNLTQHDLRATFELYMHLNPNFTDTQREKMVGAQIDVQKNLYVTMGAQHLRGLEESVQIEGLKEIVAGKVAEISGAKRGANTKKRDGGK